MPKSCPRPQYERAPCEKCGATTERQAETLCRPVQDISGDYECPGKFNARGQSIRQTADSVKQQSAWFSAEAARLGW
jgi:hypothetical protein